MRDGITIPRLSHCDRPTLDRHIRSGMPFVIPGLAKDWPAVKKWTPPYLAEISGESLIPVSHYPDGATLASKVKMTVADYLRAISETEESWKYHYMESVELGEMSPALYADLAIPKYLDRRPGTSDTVFFGHSTGSCCHIHAHEEAFVFQVMGTKVFSIYHPRDVRNLYFEPIRKDYRRSRVDCSNIDHERFPNARNAQRIDVTLHPGDAMYLPVHWAHWTAAEGFTFTMTRFFEASLRHYRYPSPGLRCIAGRLLLRLQRNKGQ